MDKALEDIEYYLRRALASSGAAFTPLMGEELAKAFSQVQSYMAHLESRVAAIETYTAENEADKLQEYVSDRNTP